MNEFDWQEFFTYAQDIYNRLKTVGTDFDGAQEALCRSAISRAYYASFHSAKDFLHIDNSALQRKEYEGSHEVVINALRNQPNPELKDVAEELQALKSLRARADYKSDCYRKTQPFDELEIALDSAEYISGVIYRQKLKLLRTKKN